MKGHWYKSKWCSNEELRIKARSYGSGVPSTGGASKKISENGRSADFGVVFFQESLIGTGENAKTGHSPFLEPEA